MSDKSNETIEPLVNYLGALKNETRIAIVQILSKHKTSIEYSEIQKELGDNFGISSNLSYHLKILKAHMIISGDENGYILTDMGQKTRTFLHSVEEVVTPETPIRIRTSKYAIEFFDESVIERKLQEEAGMPANIAKEIAGEAKTRLKKAKVTYLTAPLVREYINAILIEHHYEYYRAKLTRLGVPPFDITKMLSTQWCSTPKYLRTQLGKQVMEQYVLLNMLQRKYADAFLTGEFLFADLERFGTSPLELVITGAQFEVILNRFLNNRQKTVFNELKLSQFQGEPLPNSIFDLQMIDLVHVIQNFFQLIAPFFPEGLNILRFDLFLEKFLTKQSEVEPKQALKWLLDYWNPFSQQNWKITLEISLIANYTDLSPLLEIYGDDLGRLMESKFKQTNNQEKDKAQANFIQKENKQNHACFNNYTILPTLIIHGQKSDIKPLVNMEDFSKLTHFQQLLLMVLLHPQVKFDQYTKWGWPFVDHIYTNLHIPIAIEKYALFKPAVVLEKISINLLALYFDSNRDLSTFWKKLEIALFQVFDFFEQKYSQLSRHLPQFSNWVDIQSLVFPQSASQAKFIPNGRMVGAVSFHGLEEMIFMHTDLFLRMQPKNRQLAVKIMDFMQKLLDKQNLDEKNPIHYVLAETHPQKELLHPSNDILTKVIQKQQKLYGESTCRSSFSLNFADQIPTSSIGLILKIFRDLQASSFKELTLRFQIPLHSLNIEKSNATSSINKAQVIFSPETLENIRQLLSIKNYLLDISFLFS
ncbi:MAG: DUF7347 domain-containing protein [Promethearchaeota archaeon]